MHTKVFSIGGLIGVHASSIVYWGYQDNFKPVYLYIYFLWQKDLIKISSAQKHLTSKN